MEKKRCRHPHFMLLWPMLWCPDCGALRKAKEGKGANGKPEITPAWSGWLYPRGSVAACNRLVEVSEPKVAGKEGK